MNTKKRHLQGGKKIEIRQKDGQEEGTIKALSKAWTEKMGEDREKRGPFSRRKKV